MYSDISISERFEPDIKNLDKLIIGLTRKINNIPISAVASVKTSGVFVTAMPLFFAASKSIFPKPTAKFEIIFTVSGKLLIVSASNLSVKADNIPSQP